VARYEVHLTEPYGEETPSVITNVQIEEAKVNNDYSILTAGNS
jgi:hypothetical protein